MAGSAGYNTLHQVRDDIGNFRRHGRNRRWRRSLLQHSAITVGNPCNKRLGHEHAFVGKYGICSRQLKRGDTGSSQGEGQVWLDFGGEAEPLGKLDRRGGTNLFKDFYADNID